VRADATYGWSEPDQHGRMSAELWAQIKNEDWSLVSPTSADGRSVLDDR